MKIFWSIIGLVLGWIIFIIIIWFAYLTYKGNEMSKKEDLNSSEEQYYQDNQGCVDAGRGCL